MDDNPYASPAELIEPRLPQVTGVWRDGHRLVASLDNPPFPPRCVKTNASVAKDETCEIYFDWIAHQGLWTFLFGLAGQSLVKTLFGKRGVVTVGVSDVWLADEKRKTRIAQTVMAAGLLTSTLAAAVLTYLTPKPFLMANPGAEWLLLTVLFGLPAAALSAIFLPASQKPVLSLHRVKAPYVWFDGAHPDFLASLPEWPPE